MRRPTPGGPALLLSTILLFSVSPVLAGGRSLPRVAEHVKRNEGFAREETSVPLLGKVTVYRPRPVERARGVVLFVSGDGGWKLGVPEMAKRIAPKALVVGISMPAWQKEVEKRRGTCWYPAGELEAIAQAVEKIYRFPRYIRPILVGYSSGATVVYGALSQSPEGSFAGAVSLGFCPDLEVRRPFCGRGAWRPAYNPKKHLTLLPVRPDLPQEPAGGPSWVVLQGQIDKVCSPPDTRRFVDQVAAGKLVPLPKVGHGFGVTRNWGEAFDAAVDSFLAPVGAWEPAHVREKSRAPNLAPLEINRRLEALDLPLIVTWPESASDVLIFVSGDGGWMDLDQEVASRLHNEGVAVIGWSTLRYFWQARTPERFRRDLARVLNVLPEGMRLFAGGYSFGAEVVPAALAEDPRSEPALERIRGLVLIGPGRYATFEVSPLDWIFHNTTPTAHPVRAALERKLALPVLCLKPADDEDSGCPLEGRAGLLTVTLPGSHHFGGDYASLAKKIALFLRSTAEGAAPGKPLPPEP